jgi:beta-lactamase class D
MGIHRGLSAGVIALSCLAIPQAHVQDVLECVVIYDEQADAYWRSDATRCTARLSPASTFKIPHALMALETGVITADTLEAWDRTAYPNRASWQADHRLESAIRNSVLWFFQRTAVRIGPSRMRVFLKQVEYGNADTSGPADRYWINGRLRISADEQVGFLRRFYAGRMPVAAAHVATVRRALVQPARSVQNSTGLHVLSEQWREGTELSAKTGAGTAREEPGERVSWLVGRLTVGGRHYIFASNIVRRGAVDPVDAARLAFRTFRARGLI